MKLQLNLTRAAQGRLIELVKAKDKTLLSTLHELGVTELRGEHETIRITPTFPQRSALALVAQKLGLKSHKPEPAFTISITRTAMPFRTEVSMEDAGQQIATPGGSHAIPNRAIELLGMFVESQKHVNPAILQRFVLALEKAVARKDSDLVESMAASLHVAQPFLQPDRIRGVASATEYFRLMAAANDVAMTPPPADGQEQPQRGFLYKRPKEESASDAQHAGIPASSPTQVFSATSELQLLVQSLSTRPDAQTALRQSLSHLDSMWSRSLESPNSGASENAMVVVLDAVRQLAVLSDEPTATVKKALGQIASIALIPLPELRWRLQKRQAGFGPQAAGELLAEGIDVSWELLASLALLAVAHGMIRPDSVIAKGDDQDGDADGQADVPARQVVRFETDIPARVARSIEALKRVAQAISLKINARTDRQAETLNHAIKLLFAQSEFRRSEPALFLQTAARLAISGGNLLWHDCLALANARARHHRFLDPEDAVSNVEVQHDVETGAGGITIRFSVVQKRIPRRIRETYDQLALAGRIQVMSELVEFAKQHHTTAIQVSSAQIARQMEMNDEELFRSIRKKTIG